MHCCAVVSSIRPPAVWKGAIIKIHSLLLSFRPSICPSVAYTANNSTTQRPSVHKFGRKVPHLWCDSHTSFKVKKSGSPGPLTLTYIVCRIFRIGLRTSNLVYRWRTTTRISHRRCDLLGQRSRSRGSVWAVLAQCCTCVTRGRRGHIMSAELRATLVVKPGLISQQLFSVASIFYCVTNVCIVDSVTHRRTC